ncbi:MAG: signal peptidase I [Verrucomicrobia bacterium]|nr:signal peptidase I [Verrucomicrobiota bacterium]
MKNHPEPGVEKQGNREETQPRPDVSPVAALAARPPAGGLFLKWFCSGTVRHALQMRKHVGKILCAQRDLLTPPAIQAVEKAMRDVRALCAAGDKAAIQAGMDELEKMANKWLKPHPFPGLRENIEVLLVAIAVAMAIRTFFLQPFKIPTGSMQPTLWGITSNPDFLHDGGLHDDLRPQPDFEIPNFLRRFAEYWVGSVSYTHVVARTEGAVREVQDQPFRVLIFDLWQTFRIGDDPHSYTIWFPPDNVFRRAGLLTPYGYNTKVFKPGEDIIKMRSVSGDHLFVDRMTYNFRRPQRGEIVVFETRHIEKLKISPNRRLIVNNGKELTAATPHFENLYTFDRDHEPPPNHYFGHGATELFANGQEYEVPHNHYVVMGDNTRNSLDSRYWGGFPRDDVIGTAWFVYWPISGGRFGWGYR